MNIKRMSCSVSAKEVRRRFHDPAMLQPVILNTKAEGLREPYSQSMPGVQDLLLHDLSEAADAFTHLPIWLR